MSRFAHLLAAAAVVACVSAPASAAVIVTSITQTADARAFIGSTPPGPADHDTDFVTTTGDLLTTAHQIHQIISPTISSEVSSSVSSQITSPSSGAATLSTTWTSTNQLLQGDPLNIGSFASTLFFQYAFQVTEPMKVIVDITTTSAGGDPEGSLSLNHDFGIGPPSHIGMTFENLDLVGIKHLEYTVNTGFHHLLVEHSPNATLSPFPVGTFTATTQMTFSIVPVPEPSTLFLGAGLAAMLIRRRTKA